VAKIIVTQELEETADAALRRALSAAQAKHYATLSKIVSEIVEMRAAGANFEALTPLASGLVMKTMIAEAAGVPKRLISELHDRARRALLNDD